MGAGSCAALLRAFINKLDKIVYNILTICKDFLHIFYVSLVSKGICAFLCGLVSFLIYVRLVYWDIKALFYGQ